MIRECRVHARRVLPGEREMIEPYGRVDFESFPSLRAGFDGSLGAGLKVQRLILSQFGGLAVELDSGRSVLADDDQFLAEGLFRINRIGLHLDTFEQRASPPRKLRRYSGRNRHAWQFGRFHRRAVPQHHRHADSRQFSCPTRYFGLIDNTLVDGGPLRGVTAPYRLPWRAVARSAVEVNAKLQEPIA